MWLFVQEPKLFQLNIGSIISQSIPCATCAIVPNSFQRDSQSSCSRPRVRLAREFKVWRSQLITWLFQSLQEGRSFLFWLCTTHLVGLSTHIQHHQKVLILCTHVSIILLAWDSKTQTLFAEVTLLQSLWKRYMIWDGCRKRHCLEDGRIIQSASVWSEHLRNVADVYTFKLALRFCPSCGRSLAGMRQLQSALTSGRKPLELNARVQTMHWVNCCFIEPSNQISIQTKAGSECITSTHGWVEVGIWTQVQRCFDSSGLSSVAWGEDFVRSSSWQGSVHTWQGDFSIVWCCGESTWEFFWSLNWWFGTSRSFAHFFHWRHAWSQKENQTSLHHRWPHSAVGSYTRLSCLLSIYSESHAWVSSQTWRSSWSCFACAYTSCTGWVGRTARWGFSTWFGFWIWTFHCISWSIQKMFQKRMKIPFMGLLQVRQLLQALRAMQLQCCLKIMFKSCFRILLIRGVRLVALVPRRLQKRGFQNMAKVNTIMLAKIFCSNLRVPKTLTLVKLDINLEDPHGIEQLIAQVGALKGCSIHGSIGCRPWSQWQHLNRKKYPKLAARINQEQAESAALVEQFIRVADIYGGDCSFEWRRYCTGWALPSIQSWILERNLHSATFNGCTVGVEADGQPAKKPWRFITSSLRLADNLAALKCTRSKHAPLQGKWTRMSAFYPEPLCNLMINSLFPHVANQHVFNMPCNARSQQSHRQKLVKGHPSVPLDVLIAEAGCHEIRTFRVCAGKKLDRNEWKGHPEALKAIENEKQDLLVNGTWDESSIRPKSEILAMGPSTGNKIHISHGYCEYQRFWKAIQRLDCQSSDCVSRGRGQGWGGSNSSVWWHCSLSSHQPWWTQLDCGL